VKEWFEFDFHIKREGIEPGVRVAAAQVQSGAVGAAFPGHIRISRKARGTLAFPTPYFPASLLVSPGSGGDLPSRTNYHHLDQALSMLVLP
jgi:hypothetical protein